MSTGELGFGELSWWDGTRDRLRWGLSRAAARTIRVAGTAPTLAFDLFAVVVGVVFAERLLLDTMPSAARAGLIAGDVFWFALSVGAISVTGLATQGFYLANRHPNRARTVKAVLSATAVALVMATFVAGPDLEGRLGASLLAPAWVSGSVCLLISRVFVLPRYIALFDSVRSPSRVLIVGADPVGQRLASELGSRCHLVGYADDSVAIGQAAPGLLGGITDLPDLVERHDVDEIIVALPVARQAIRDVLTRGFARRVRISFLADVGTLLPPTFELRQLASRPYVSFEPVAPVTWVKRLSDIILATIAVVAFSPVFVFVAVAIRRDSPGPVFHRQTRLGMNGRPFRMLKFRSMRADAEDARAQLDGSNDLSGPLFKIRRDPRVTRVGRVLRRTSLDELPQLFNVLRGDMSLVGPRPPLPREVEQYESWQFGRLRVRPGMTGLWQVNGRSDIPFTQMVRFDVYYARNWSLWLDLKILVRTPLAVISRRGAY